MIWDLRLTVGTKAEFEEENRPLHQRRKVLRSTELTRLAGKRTAVMQGGSGHPEPVCATFPLFQVLVAGGCHVVAASAQPPISLQLLFKFLT